MGWAKPLLTHTNRLVCNSSMTPRQPDLTRTQILDAAFAEIRRQGYRSASVADILAATGLTKGAFYHHFPSKKALGLAVVDERIGALLDELVMQPLGGGRQSVLALLDLLAGNCSPDKETICLGCPLNNLMQEMSPLDEDFRAHLGAILVRWQKAVENLLRRAQAAGEICAEVDCRAASLFIVAAWEGGAGIAKNMQSVQVFSDVMSQLRTHVAGLFVAG